jgi:CDP-6-deoxy-D-xylo-4-hexulose-3-dehydrase
MIKLIKSTFYNEAKTKKQLAEFIMNADMLSFGNECIKFEKKFARYHKRKHAIFVNSGSSANLAMIQALLNSGKLKRGDNIGFSALTWSTNVMPIIQLGFNAIPIDVELDTLNVSSGKLIETINTYKLKALFLTNLLGFCDDLDNIQKVCKQYNIILIEDNCESLGTVYRGNLLGNYGMASSCSFYVGHHMSTIEGGVVCTDDDDFADMLRLVRAHGWDRNLAARNQTNIRKKFNVNSTFYSRYTFYDFGYNFRPTEINGFIGNIQIKYLPKIVKRRNEIFLRIAEKLYSRSNLYYPLRYGHIEFVSNFAIPLICKSTKIRDELVKKSANKVEIRPVVGGDMTQQPFFRNTMTKFKHMKADSNAKIIHNQGLYFGNNPELTEKEIDLLIETFSTL